jgi:hypothetical protein
MLPHVTIPTPCGGLPWMPEKSDDIGLVIMQFRFRHILFCPSARSIASNASAYILSAIIKPYSAGSVTFPIPMDASTGP